MKIRWHTWFVALFFVATIIGGAIIYSYFEGWSLFNSFYFVIITITTIGYGDLTPLTVYGKSLTMFLAFFGVGLALYIISQISSNISKKTRQKLTK